MTTLVDPLVCLSHRESPEDGAPLCGAWLSEHCPDCGLCPGVHADDCAGDVLLDMSEIRCPRCGAVFPWHTTDCVTPRSATYPTKEGSTDAR